MKEKQDRRNGQTMVEYIIIVVIIAIAAIAIFGIFGDTIRQKLGGAVAELGGDDAARQEAVGESGDSQQWLRNLDGDGAGSGN